MHSIVQLFIRHGGLLTLVVVEVVCLFLIAQYNDPQKKIAQASWLRYSGTVMGWKADVYAYFNLASDNRRLRDENTRLQTQLANQRVSLPAPPDSLQARLLRDTASRKAQQAQFTFIPASVISNTISLRNNWMMINRGTRHGVKVNSGVISADGLVGVVRTVSEESALVMSVLHGETKVSAALKKGNYFGSLTWEGGDPTRMRLSDIPYHIPVKARDTVVVSQYSMLFPSGHAVGQVDTAYRMPGSNFLFIKVRLAQNPATVQDVYVVINKYSEQIEQLQQAAQQ